MEAQKKVVNRALNLTYEEYLLMGEDLTSYAFGDYVIEQKIGQGAFGRVYKGFNSKTGQKVAIKTINFEMLLVTYCQPTLSKILYLCKTEDVLMRMCHSDNIVKCFQVFQNKSLKVIVMEYCSGGTLDGYIKESGRIPQRQALKIFKQILNGISAMHDKSIMHRDLKPENILINQGVFKICDLGFSKISMNTTTTVGTRPYMAPQIINRQKYGLKVDIWSAAVILYEMIFQQHPFKEQQKQKLLLQMKGSSIYKEGRITANNYTASQKISKFIKRMLVIDPSKRMGWRQLLQDPIFNNKEEYQLPRSVIVDCPMIAPSQVSISQIGSQIQQSYQKLISSIEIKGRDSTDIIIKKMSAQSIRIKKDNVKTQKDNIYLYMNINLIQCLKIELIYNEIILKIEQFKMLDLSERKSIQIMYLLSQRCYINMSAINSQMGKRTKDHIFIEQVYYIINYLFNKAQKTFDKYDKILTQEQNKLLNRFKDFFFSQSQEEKQSDIYFNGFQKTDYSREQHIKFTQSAFINKMKNELKGPFKEVDKVRRYLMNYELINKISLQHLKTTNFDAYIQSLIEN